MSKLRADAAARRDLILDAADAVFSEHGVTAPLDLVVERAGVGRATLYRNFPDRTALMEAMLDRSLQALEAVAEEYAGQDKALFMLFERMAHNIAASPPLVDFWRTIDRDNEIFTAARKRIAEIFRDPLKNAIASGLCRPDLKLSDISLVSGMLGAALRGHSLSTRRGLAKRTLELMCSGLNGPGMKADE